MLKICSKKISVAIFFVCLINLKLLITPLMAKAGTENKNSVQIKNDKTISLYMENDTFNQTDRHYTNGFKLSWIVHDLSNFSAIASLLNLINLLRTPKLVLCLRNNELCQFKQSRMT